MAKQTINLGTTPNDHTGDAARTAFDKVNDNFTEVYDAIDELEESKATLPISQSDVTGLVSALSGKAASSHTHAISDTTGLQAALDAKAAASDLTSHTGNTSNPHSVTKAQVGLGNCDNTSDANKPVSTAQQTALDLKLDANHASVTNARTPTGSAGGVLSGTFPNPGFAVDMATQAELDAGLATKAAASHAHAQSDVTGLVSALSGKEPAQTAASQAEAEAGTGTNVRSWTPQRIAQAIAALGGSAVVQTGVAFVDATVGDDGTGEVGNPAAPFETIQGAFDAGATCFSIAFGNVGPLDVGDWAGTLSFIGVGRGFSSIGAITRTGAAPGLLKLIGNGKDMLTVESITNAGTNGADGTNGVNPGDPGTNGGGGEAAGDIEVYGVFVLSSVVCVGGDGGAAGNGADGDGIAIVGGAGGAGGDGGGCGACLVEECYVGGSVLVNGGDGTNGGHGGDDVLVGGNGGNGGSGGAAGALTIRRSTVAGTSNAGGALGAGGGGGTGAVNGTPGADGVAGAKANFNGYFSESGVPADYDTAVVRAVVIDGTFYADTYP